MGQSMNKRLRILAEKANVVIYDKENAAALEKFAELIVADCAEAIGKNIVGSVHSSAGPWNSAVAKCQQVLRDHYTAHGDVENE